MSRVHGKQLASPSATVCLTRQATAASAVAAEKAGGRRAAAGCVPEQPNQPAVLQRQPAPEEVAQRCHPEAGGPHGQGEQRFVSWMRILGAL